MTLHETPVGSWHNNHNGTYHTTATSSLQVISRVSNYKEWKDAFPRTFFTLGGKSLIIVAYFTKNVKVWGYMTIEEDIINYTTSGRKFQSLGQHAPFHNKENL